ncbi:MAG TPA: M23 family metallopeptidase, partial [Alphaproteobacteria bacterium]|nr:M23 family metallopeptidase [Alphaproteobacteria bacterium]
PQTVPASRPYPATLSDPPPRAGGAFSWPVRGRLLSAYGPKKGGLHNDGINIAAARGTPVKAAENGVVVYAGSGLQGYGNLVLIRHRDRWVTAYGHMDKVHVRKGDVLRRGQTIGTTGSTGSVDSPQLHFEIRRGTKAINPKPLLG